MFQTSRRQQQEESAELPISHNGAAFPHHCILATRMHSASNLRRVIDRLLSRSNHCHREPTGVHV